MNQLDSFLKTVMAQASHAMTDEALSSVDAMVQCADRAGESAVREFVKWQPRPLAKVIQMPDRRKRREKT
jgi:hypothetical protein